MSQLAAALDTNSGNTSTICKKKKKTAFLFASAVKMMSALYHFFLTEKGETVLTDLDSRIEETYQPIFHNVPEDRLMQIYKGTQALKDVMLQINKQKRED